MTTIRFFEKPGCVGNARQKQLLKAAGYQLEVIDLLSYPWSEQALLAFVGELPVSAWFNSSAPAIKSGEIDPQALSAAQALPLLLATPLLIRRPLMVVGGQHLVGFEPSRLARWLPALQGDYESCPQPQQPCANL